MCVDTFQHMIGLAPKCTVVKGDMLYDREMVGLQACVWTHFSPEIVQAGAVKRLSCFVFVFLFHDDEIQGRMLLPFGQRPLLHSSAF